MPAIPSTAPNFKIDTDYPLDKVIYLKSGSGAIASGGTITIPHGLPFTPLVGWYWSLTSDFSIAYEDNVGPFPSGNIGFFFTLQVAINADATNIYLQGNGTLGSTTIYYRIYAFEPDDSNVSLTATSNSADNFSLSTDYNYTKLLTTAHFSLAAGATTTIPHNLGYIPQVSGWFLSGGFMNPFVYASFDPSNTPYSVALEATTTNLIFSNGSLSNVVVYYRCYLDE